MKALIDRMADVIHCQYFDGKYCAAVCTAGRDDKVITQSLTTNFLDLGAYVTGTVGAVVTRGPPAVDAAEALAFTLGVALVADLESQRPDFGGSRSTRSGGSSNARSASTSTSGHTNTLTGNSRTGGNWYRSRLPGPHVSMGTPPAASLRHPGCPSLGDGSHPHRLSARPSAPAASRRLLRHPAGGRAPGIAIRERS